MSVSPTNRNEVTTKSLSQHKRFRFVRPVYKGRPFSPWAVHVSFRAENQKNQKSENVHQKSEIRKCTAHTMKVKLTPI